MYIDKSNNYLEEQTTKIGSYKQRQRKQKRTITNKLNNNENIEIHFYTTNK